MRRIPTLIILSLNAVALPWSAGCRPTTTGNNGIAPQPGAGASTIAAPSAAPGAPAAARSAKPATSEPDASELAALSLTIGDPAPALKVSKWLKGTPVESFADGEIYVVEFWATWCGPCRVSMPHISRLQDQYGLAVTFIGISDEHETSVRNFLTEVQDAQSGKSWDESITYRIALDDVGEPMGQAYMKAARQNGIPTSFIVGKDGRIEWIGHPLEIDAPLSQVVGGQWDRAAALAQFRGQQKIEELMARLRTAVRRGRSTNDWSEVNRILDGATSLDIPTAMLKRLHFDVAVLSGTFEQARLRAEELSTAIWDDAQQLNSLAWDMATRIPRESQDHELALRIARRAAELTQEQDGVILDTVARIYYDGGDVEQAVSWQRRAVEHAPDGMDQLSKTLKRYESDLSKRRPPR
jgi:thiol-disulfide isomerase/thioredoxin